MRFRFIATSSNMVYLASGYRPSPKFLPLAKTSDIPIPLDESALFTLDIII